MTVWGMPGAEAFMNKPTGAQRAAEARAARRRSALGDAEAVRAQRDEEIRVLRDRHAQMLASATDPLLRALIEAHGPNSDGLWPDCGECPAVPSDYGDADPESWPCHVWVFISDRVEGT